MACSVGQDNKQSQQHLPRCIDVTIYALLTKSMSRWLDTGRVFFSDFMDRELFISRGGEKEPTVFVAQIHESRLCFLCFDCLQPPFATLSPMYVRFKFVFARDQSGQSRAARVTNQNTEFASYWPRALRYNKCIHIHKHGMFSYWKIINWNKDITSQRAPLTQAPYSYPDINFFARGPTLRIKLEKTSKLNFGRNWVL